MGLWLFIRGLLGRKVAVEPNCRRCGYLLAHLTAERCPECGTPVSEANTRRWKRQRSLGRAALGLILTGLAIAPELESIEQFIRKTDWYHYKPTAFVLNDLDSPATLVKAIVELQHREAAGDLSEKHRHRLIARALEDHRAGLGGSRYLAGYLGEAVTKGTLTDDQLDAFLDGCTELFLKVRPTVGRSDQIPYETVTRAGGFKDVGHPFWVKRVELPTKVNGEIVNPGGRDYSYPTGVELREPRRLDSAAIGQHELQLGYEYTVYAGRYRSESSQVIGTRVRILKEQFEVVPVAPEIKRLDPELFRTAVLSSIRAPRANLSEMGLRLNLLISAERPPCDLAFDIIGRSEGAEFSLGTLVCAKGERIGTGGSFPVKTTPAPQRLRLLLRPSDAAARSHPTIQRIYGAEIELPEIPVQARE